MNTTTQPRAKTGGETGANGQWYAGGEFIATIELAKREGRQRKAAAKRAERQAEIAARLQARAAIQARLQPKLEARFGAQCPALGSYRFFGLCAVAAKAWGVSENDFEALERMAG